MNKARGCCGAGRNAPPLLPVSPGHPVTSSVTFPAPVCSCVVDGYTRAQHSSTLWKEHQLPGTGWKPSQTKPGVLVGSIPSSPPSSSAAGAAAAGCWCSHISRSSQIQLHPRVQEREAAVLARAARAEFDSRRAMGGVTVLGAKVTQVINNSWPGVEPPPCTNPLFRGTGVRAPHFEAAALPFVGRWEVWAGPQVGKHSRGEEAAASPAVPLYPLARSGSPARGCPPSPAPCGSQMSRGRAAHGAAVA